MAAARFLHGLWWGQYPGLCAAERPPGSGCRDTQTLPCSLRCRQRALTREDSLDSGKADNSSELPTVRPRWLRGFRQNLAKRGPVGRCSGRPEDNGPSSGWDGSRAPLPPLAAAQGQPASPCPLLGADAAVRVLVFGSGSAPGREGWKAQGGPTSEPAPGSGRPSALRGESQTHRLTDAARAFRASENQDSKQKASGRFRAVSCP